MELSTTGINWFAIVLAVVLGQVISTLWFTVLFGDPWAREYGVASRAEHTKAIPGPTYGVQLACTVALTLTLALLQRGMDVESVDGGLALGILVAVGLVAANLIPGQAFLGRWRVAVLTVGCQSAMVLAISTLLAAWR